MPLVRIDRIDTLEDLTAAIAALAQAATDPDWFDVASFDLYRDDRTVPSADELAEMTGMGLTDWHTNPESDAPDTIPGQAELDLQVDKGPLRYVACPDRGTHTRLNDCWMCWTDVHLGHATQDDVLRPTR